MDTLYVEGFIGTGMRLHKVPPKKYPAASLVPKMKDHRGWDRHFYEVARGQLKEWNDATGAHRYVREVPPDQAVAILAAEARVGLAEDALRSARAELRGLLEVAALRGRKVRVQP